jgi:hypothetical protein
MPIMAGRLLLQPHGRLCHTVIQPFEELLMTPLGTFAAGLQVIASWLMSVLSLLAILVSVIICIVFVELMLGRAAVAQAYTIKNNSSHSNDSSASDRSAI